MNALKKKNTKIIIKYTWPIYIIVAILVSLLLRIVFGIAHPLPAYKTIYLFVSGEVINSKKLTSDLLEKYKDKELKDVSYNAVLPTDGIYETKRSVTGYSTADILIMPDSKLVDLNVSAFALEFDEELNTFFQGATFFVYESLNYGIKIDKEKVKDYMTLPGDENFYMFLNATSHNLGKYSKEQNEDHNVALLLVNEWRA